MGETPSQPSPAPAPAPDPAVMSATAAAKNDALRFQEEARRINYDRDRLAQQANIESAQKDYNLAKSRQEATNVGGGYGYYGQEEKKNVLGDLLQRDQAKQPFQWQFEGIDYSYDPEGERAKNETMVAQYEKSLSETTEAPKDLGMSARAAQATGNVQDMKLKEMARAAPGRLPSGKNVFATMLKRPTNAPGSIQNRITS